MIRRTKLFILLAVVFGVSGCQTTVSPDTRFSATSPKAIVVVGVSNNYEDGTGYELTFLRPEESDTNPAEPFSIGDFAGWEDLDGDRFFATEVQPGRYVLAWVKSQRRVATGLRNTTSFLCKGTFEFDLEPGTVNYIANFQFGNALLGTTGDAGLMRLPDRLEEARDWISAYPGIEPRMEKTPLRRTSFGCPGTGVS